MHHPLLPCNSAGLAAYRHVGTSRILTHAPLCRHRRSARRCSRPCSSTLATLTSPRVSRYVDFFPLTPNPNLCLMPNIGESSIRSNNRRDTLPLLTVVVRSCHATEEPPHAGERPVLARPVPILWVEHRARRPGAFRAVCPPFRSSTFRCAMISVARSCAHYKRIIFNLTLFCALQRVPDAHRDLRDRRVAREGGKGPRQRMSACHQMSPCVLFRSE